MSITAGHLWGWSKELELKPRLDELFGEPLRKIEYRYSLHDFETDHYLVDLKSRMPPLTEDSHDEWLAPCCKFFETPDGREIVCFYYFEASKKLYYIIYDPELFATYTRFRNRNNQLTYKIPKGDWTLV